MHLLFSMHYWFRESHRGKFLIFAFQNLALMKLNFLFTFLFTALLSSSVFGQKTTQVIYNMSIASDNPQMQSMQSMFDGSKLEILANDKFCRADMTLGSLTSTSTIIDVTSQNAILLMTSMAGNIAMKLNADELKEKNAEQNNISVTLTDSIKKIAGYNCKKAIVATDDSIKFDMWYTTDLNIGDLSGTPLAYDKIPGVPLEFSMHKGPVNMKCTATKIDLNATVDSGTFDMTIPEGYKLMTLDELKKMGGQ